MNVYKFSGEMKVPTRAAPPPPSNASSWSSSIFSSKVANQKCNQPKKKPPPRPPPPKFAQAARSQERHSQLIAGLFPKSKPINENTGSLIDWSSPPSSPTSTTRSSSDALSVNSFGSDSATHSSGAASNVESGFEDDFELFGSQNSRTADPWSPPPASAIAAKPATANWVTFSPHVAKKQIMPTIIRPKPERPKFPKVLEKKVEMDALAEVFQNVRIEKSIPRVEDEDDGWSSDSPPMPTCPPPAPPPELLAGLLEETILSDNSRTEERVASTALALFDYQGAPGDVSFRKGDHLRIIRHIDEHWVEAEINNLRGSAPTNHLQFESNDSRLVTALYAFSPETWEDLHLEPGVKVRLMGRINSDWLYGEANGRKGQFPANFVDHVPQDLPAWTQ